MLNGQYKKIMEIVRVDRKILVALQRNNRIPNLELAELVRLSPPACLKRVKRLREEGVIIGDVSIINPKLVGSTMTLIVSVEMERDRADIYQVFRKSILKAPEVTQSYQISGSYDFMLVVTVKDIQGYEQFVERVLRTDLNIRKFHTSVSLWKVKFSTEIELEE
jgi:Lrp/AsnC family leucine-responsive transcriptional regulator